MVTDPSGRVPALCRPLPSHRAGARRLRFVGGAAAASRPGRRRPGAATWSATAKRDFGRARCWMARAGPASGAADAGGGRLAVGGCRSGWRAGCRWCGTCRLGGASRGTTCGSMRPMRLIGSGGRWSRPSPRPSPRGRGRRSNPLPAGEGWVRGLLVDASVRVIQPSARNVGKWRHEQRVQCRRPDR